MKHNKPKDPKKVAAGKARAAKALRNTSGQLTSNSFKEEVQKIALSSGFTGKDLQRYYEQNADEIDPYLSRGIVSQNRYSIKTIEKVVKKSRKNVWLYKDGETFKTTPERISFEMAQFEQYCYTNRNATGVVWKKMKTGTGEPLVKIPDIDDETEELDDIEFVGHCFYYGVIVWISDLKNIKDKKLRERRQAMKENKLQNAKAIRKANRAKRTSRKGKF